MSDKGLVKIRITREIHGDCAEIRDKYIPKLKKAFQHNDVNPNQFMWEVGNDEMMVCD